MNNQPQVKLTFTATIHGGLEPHRVTVSGRAAWFLLSLMQAGKRGVTTLERPAPRIGHYLFQLRRAGFNVTTDYETHGGVFGGNHGRFKLVDDVTVEGGTLGAYLDSTEGRREFPNAVFARAAA